MAAAPEKAPLIRTARQVNDARPGLVLAEILAALAAEGRDVPSVAGGRYEAAVADGIGRETVTDRRGAPSGAGGCCESCADESSSGCAALSGRDQDCAPAEEADCPVAESRIENAIPGGRSDAFVADGSSEACAGSKRPEGAAGAGPAATGSASASVMGQPLPLVAVLGLTFKPDIDDLRASPALEVATGLAASGRCRLLVVEPCLAALPSPLAPPGARLVTLEEALHKAGLICALVAHAPFAGLEARLRPGQQLLDFAGLRALPGAALPEPADRPLPGGRAGTAGDSDRPAPVAVRALSSGPSASAPRPLAAS